MTENASVKTVSEKLSELRDSRGWTHQDVADKLGIDRVTYTNWENGKRHPSRNNVKKIASLYNVSVAYLLNDDADDLPSGSEDVVVFDVAGTKYVMQLKAKIPTKLEDVLNEKALTLDGESIPSDVREYILMTARMMMTRRKA